MMAPERYEELATATAAGSPGISGTTRPGSGPLEARAPLRWPYRSREQQERAQQLAEEAAKSETSPESSEESEDERWQGGDGRVQGEEGYSDEEQSSEGSSAPALDESATAQDRLPDTAASLITDQALASRAALIFAVGAAGPAASGLPRLAPKATKLLVKLAAAYMKDLKKVSIDALSAAYGNFDKVVGLGWLLADAVGLPLLTRETAYAVGIKARREAGYIEKAEAAMKKDLSRAKSKLSPTDPQRLQLDGTLEADMAKLLQQPVDVALPDAAAPAPRPASGSRKRKRELASAEPTFDELIADADVDVLKAEKARKRAEASLERAERNEEERFKVIERFTLKLEKLDTDATSVKQMNHWVKLHKDAEERWREAELETKDAQIALLEARLEEKEADVTLLQLTGDHLQAASERERAALVRKHEAELALAGLAHRS